MERLEPRQMLSLAPLGLAGVVNTHVDGLQQTFSQTRASAVAVGPNGDAIVVWASEDQDSSSSGVYAQRFDAVGARLGEEFQINTTTYDSQTFPSVAIDDEGDFVVTWSSLFQDGGGYGVYARRYDSTGVAQGGEFRVNQHTPGNQNFSSVAMHADGDFVIAWTSSDQDGDKTGVYARRFDAAGAAAGNEFLVNTTTQGNQRQADVSMDAGGGFFVVWNSADQDGGGGGIFGRRYQFDATPLGDEIAVNTTTTGNQQFPAIDSDASGTIVVWQSFDTEVDDWKVYAQRFDAQGNADGDELFVATGRTASVTKGPGNDFVVAWETDGIGESEILARHFGSVGQPWGATVSLGGGDRGSQNAASIARTDSRLVVVHTEVMDDGTGTDTDAVLTYGDIVPDDNLNQPPQIDDIADQTVDEETLLELTASASDPDSDPSTLSFSLAGSPPAGVAIDPASGLLSWTPTEAQGPGVYAVTVRVTDAGSPPLSDVTSFWITVDEANLSPQINPIEPQTTDQDETASVTVTAVDDDLPPNALTFSLAEDAPDGAAIDPSSGLFSWTPDTDVTPGDYEITVVVNDDGDPSLDDSATLSVRVEPALLESIPDQTVAEGQPLIVTLEPTGADEFADSVTLSLDATTVEGVAFDPASGEFSWTPTEEQGPGTYQFTVRASDSENYVLDDTETFTVNVTEESQPPVLDPIDDLFCRRGHLLSTTITGLDPDVPADDLTFSLDAGDAHGAAIDSSTGEFTWDIPWWQPKGKYDLSVTLSDGSSTPEGTTATFSVIVNELGDELVMFPIINRIVPEGLPITFTAALRKRGPAEGIVSYELGPGAPDGATITPAGQFSWTPGQDTGGEAFEITVIAHDQAATPLETSEMFAVFVQMPPQTMATYASTPAPLLNDAAIEELTSQESQPPPLDYRPIVSWLDLTANSSTNTQADKDKETTESLIMELMKTAQ
ncbi:MAG: putative Ig domain-containing protein [Planctomycetota bacterium]|nr:putative Ig domain-containing protein [Planctomycetota bacterium]